MNKKAQTFTIGVIVVTFISILVGVILFQTVAQEAGKTTSTGVYNSSINGAASQITMPASGVAIDLTGQEYISGFILMNESGNVVDAGNYTVGETVSNTTGVKTIYLQADSAEAAGETMNVSYTYGPDGYIESSGGRALAGLIALFFALAVAIIALSPTMKSGILNAFGK